MCPAGLCPRGTEACAVGRGGQSSGLSGHVAPVLLGMNTQSGPGRKPPPSPSGYPAPQKPKIVLRAAEAQWGFGAGGAAEPPPPLNPGPSLQNPNK